MSLTNSQYDAIMRIYSTIQTRNRHLQEERTRQVYARCPQLTAVENAIIDLSEQSAPAIFAGGDAAMDAYRQKLGQLAQERDELLLHSGFPADYLDPLYDCPACRDTGFIGGSPCTCFQKKVTDLFYMRSNLKNIIASENFDTFEYTWYPTDMIDAATGLDAQSNIRNVVDICRQFIDDFDTGFHNLLIYGETGVGKTFLTNCIARELLDSSHSVIYLTAIEFFEAFGRFYEDDADKAGAVDSILDCELLIIDDLGTELSNSFTNSRLFYCINERMLKKHSTIISTNLTVPALSSLYSERIVSRLTCAYTFLKIFGRDIRVQKRNINA